MIAMAGIDSAAMHGKRVLIFGASGQDGPYLEAACRKRGAEVHGYSRRTRPSCDVANFDEVEQTVSRYKPDYVFQLAAESRTAHDAVFDNHKAIAGGALNVLEAVKRHAPAARVLLAGSGLQFRNTGRPIHEDDPFEAASPYAAARIYATYLARYYRQKMGVAAYVAYLFHHESPARGPRHTSKMIALAAAKAALGQREVLQLGDISVEKEWAFAEDIVEGMLHLVLQDAVFECVVGTGEGRSIKEWLQVCYGAAGLDWRDFVTQKVGFVAEYPKLVSSPETIKKLGWAPKVSFAELADMMMAAARAELMPQRERQV